jgi:uncharacterized lipoprotein YddW (UPF0748 family)
MKRLFKSLVIIASISAIFNSCQNNHLPYKDIKVWAWYAGPTSSARHHTGVKSESEQWEHYFSKAKEVGIDAIILQVHGGYPDADSANTTDFTDYAAINMIRTAVPYAKKYGIELHAWIWTTNRCEKNLRAAHPDWYQVSAEGKSCLDVKLYNREHYRWLCPSRPEVTEYLKERVAEIAKIDGIAGVHLDFIRYPDAILPYGLQSSRGVVQDRAYPKWDHCYCDVCRAGFKAETGKDPLYLIDPTGDTEWMNFRWKAIVNLANTLAEEIHKYGKTASAAVFASPEEARKLVRQDWSGFTGMDIIFPMIYHKFYNYDDPWIETATHDGIKEMQANNCKGYLCSGLFVGHVPKGKIDELIKYTIKGGSKGICFFSLESIDRTPGYWDALKIAIKKFKERDY